MAVVQKITPCLWFDNQAEEAAKFYVSIFENSRIEAVTRYGSKAFFAMLSAGDSVKSERAMKAIMQMKKLDLSALQRAYDGRSRGEISVQRHIDRHVPPDVALPAAEARASASSCLCALLYDAVNHLGRSRHRRHRAQVLRVGCAARIVQAARGQRQRRERH